MYIVLYLNIMYMLCSQHTRNWMEIMQKLNNFQQTKAEETTGRAPLEGTYSLVPSQCSAQLSEY